MFKKTKEELIKFEEKICSLFNNGSLPYLIHLSGGNESELINIFKEINEDDYVFSTHRSHYHFLLKCGDEKKLEELICNGDSMFVFDRKTNFFTSSILAGTCGIATGVALAIKIKNKKNKVWCFIGDGAEDEGHFYEAVRFTESMGLPCCFIIEDNDRSVETNKNDRGSSYTVNWPSCVRRYKYNSIFPHGGSGTKEMISFKKEVIDRYKNSKD